MTPDLQAILRSAGIDAGGSRFELIGRFSTEVWRVVRTDGDLVIKRPYRPHRSGEPHSLEGDFYQVLGSEIPVTIPRYRGRVGDTLILDLVDDLIPFDFKAGPGSQHGIVAMRALARLHACFWRRDLPDFLPDLADPVLRGRFAAEYDQSWARNRHLLNELCPEFTLIGDALHGRLAESLLALAEPATLLHGDAHGENLPLSRRGEFVFLDWQGPRRGNPGFDIAVFLAMSYPVDRRRRVEESLLDGYADALGAHGVVLQDPWKDYRRGILRRVARIVEIVRDDFLLPRWVFQRCATAAVDLQVEELIV